MTKARVKNDATPTLCDPARPAESGPLADRLSSLSREMSAIEAKIERALATVRDAPGRIRTATAGYHQAFALADEDAMTQSREAIRIANSERDEAVAALAGLTSDVQTLADRESPLRTEALSEVVRQREAIEQARRDWAAASATLDCVGALGGKLSSLRSALGPFAPKQPAPEPEPKKAAERCEGPGKPACPRCRRNDSVTPVGADRFRCNRGFHGPLTFNTRGEIIDDQSVGAGPRRIRTTY